MTGAEMKSAIWETRVLEVVLFIIVLSIRPVAFLKETFFIFFRGLVLSLWAHVQCFMLRVFPIFCKIDMWMKLMDTVFSMLYCQRLLIAIWFIFETHVTAYTDYMQPLSAFTWSCTLGWRMSMSVSVILLTRSDIIGLIAGTLEYCGMVQLRV
jgi:hypothetical protein